MAQIHIAPSILSADFAKLGEEIKAVEPHIKYLHIDVMDGHFVPNITIGPCVVKSIRKYTKLIFDVHLMISDPMKYLDSFIDAGSDYITAHLEVLNAKEVNAFIEKIHKAGKKAGLSVKPETTVKKLEPYLDKLDMVLIMSVEPGFGGQKFMESALPKIKWLRETIDKKKSSTLICVDGGINPETAPLAKEAGAHILVSGSSVFKKDDYGKAVKVLKG